MVCLVWIWNNRNLSAVRCFVISFLCILFLKMKSGYSPMAYTCSRNEMNDSMCDNRNRFASIMLILRCILFPLVPNSVIVPRSDRIFCLPLSLSLFSNTLPLPLFHSFLRRAWLIEYVGTYFKLLRRSKKEFVHYTFYVNEYQTVCSILYDESSLLIYIDVLLVQLEILSCPQKINW